MGAGRHVRRHGGEGAEPAGAGARAEAAPVAGAKIGARTKARSTLELKGGGQPFIEKVVQEESKAEAMVEYYSDQLEKMKEHPSKKMKVDEAGTTVEASTTSTAPNAEEIAHQDPATVSESVLTSVS